MNDFFQISRESLFHPTDLDEKALQGVLKNMMGRRLDYADLYFQRSLAESWVLENRIVKQANYHEECGVGVRAVTGEKTGFAYSNVLTLEAISKAATAASSIVNENGQQKISVLNKVNGLNLYQPMNPLLTLNENEKVALLQSIDQEARQINSKVTEVIASLSGSYELVLVMASDGTLATDIRPLVRLNVSVLVEDGEKRERGSTGGGGRYDYTSLLSQAKDYTKEAVRLALVNLEAKSAPAGMMPIVLGAGWPGVLLHEAVGHGLEGDFNRKGSSIFSGRIGEQVASSLCTVIDDGTIPNRRGSLSIDDEGVPTQKTVLIENGILKGYMLDKQNAHLMKMQSTGNARRESYAHLPLPRMTNTYLQEGNSDFDEMISSVKKGIYAVNFAGGQVDITSGSFVFTTSEAYLIENGKISYPVKNATLIGNGIDVLNKISMVGSEMELDSGVGVCGKEGQSVPVGVGQPVVKIDELTVGGTN